jgi:hypothetical protein
VEPNAPKFSLYIVGPDGPSQNIVRSVSTICEEFRIALQVHDLSKEPHTFNGVEIPALPLLVRQDPPERRVVLLNDTRSHILLALGLVKELETEMRRKG